MPKLTLISHHLCPYVQRAVIALTEKDVAFERVTVDLANKPDWFRALSPLGKTPVLKVDETAIFESAVILEYLEETQPDPLHPRDALSRAEHRSLIEYSSAVLNEVWGFYSAPDEPAFEARRKQLADRFVWLENRIVGTPWLDGADFSLVDAVFGPVFRYFDVFDTIADFGVFDGLPKVQAWRSALAQRPSVRNAVTADYPERLHGFLLARRSHLSALMLRTAA
jgi:glutathione S-transferase